MEILFYFEYAYLKEYIRVFAKFFVIWAPGCITSETLYLQKKIEIGGIYLLMPDRSHDSLNQIC